MKKLWICCFVLLFFIGGFKLFAQSTLTDIPRTLTPNGIFDKLYDRFGTEYNLSDLHVRSAKFGNQTNTIATVPTESCTAGKFTLYFSPTSTVFCLGTQSMAAQTALCEVYSNVSGLIASTITAGAINIFCGDASGFIGTATSFYSFPLNASNGNQGVVDGLIYKALVSGADPYTTIPISIFSTANTIPAFYHGAVYANPNATFNFSISSPTISLGEYLFVDVMLHEAMHSLGFNSLIGPTGLSFCFAK